ncbi:hypothetical protein O181_058702 [Austropuccinia psidii MF-1]|uniref:Uncharacterized protein n=1 Tax=Austropuccinia psidii MF-1 TaxID=1389203 RepID=A0A9Q3EKA6_9BASI|nr:hypothetical protein [Austropuccinia psidii MF-1]
MLYSLETMKTTHPALLWTISSRISLQPQESSSCPSLHPLHLLEGLWQKFTSTSNVQFAPTQHNLNRHTRACRLPAYEPPPPFPAPGDINAKLAYQYPRGIVPPPEEPLLDYMVGWLTQKGKRTMAQKTHLRLSWPAKVHYWTRSFPVAG